MPNTATVLYIGTPGESDYRPLFLPYPRTAQLEVPENITYWRSAGGQVYSQRVGFSRLTHRRFTRLYRPLTSSEVQQLQTFLNTTLEGRLKPCALYDPVFETDDGSSLLLPKVYIVGVQWQARSIDEWDGVRLVYERSV